MDINKEYTQINVHSFSGYNTNYDALKGKVVDKVAFTDRDSYDTQMFIITFTDKTYVCIGVDVIPYKEHINGINLGNHYVLPPQCVNDGDYSVHSSVDKKGNVRFETWINILRDLGIWQFTDVDALEIIEKKQKEIEKKKKEEEEREYKNYLHLKKKFEGEK